jgi:hypothetical protein
MKATFNLRGYFRDNKGNSWHLVGRFFGFLHPNGSYTIRLQKIKGGNGRMVEEEITVKNDDCYGRKV